MRVMPRWAALDLIRRLGRRRREMAASRHGGLDD
jgi:hypothetical protein